MEVAWSIMLMVDCRYVYYTQMHLQLDALLGGQLFAVVNVFFFPTAQSQWAWRKVDTFLQMWFCQPLKQHNVQCQTAGTIKNGSRNMLVTVLASKLIWHEPNSWFKNIRKSGFAQAPTSPPPGLAIYDLQLKVCINGSCWRLLLQ